MTGPTDPASPIEVVDIPADAGRWVALVIGSAVFVLGAIGLELASGMAANSPVPGWADRVPLAWSPMWRCAWWVSVAAAAGGFRLGLHRLGFRQRPLVVVATIGPILAFAAGVAVGAEWAVWH